MPLAFPISKGMESEKETQLYEISYFLNPNLQEEEAVNVAQKIRELIEQKKGIVIKDTKPLKRKLAYEIKKHLEGFFSSIKFLFNPAEIIELKNELEQNKEVLRMQLIKTSKEEAIIRSRPQKAKKRTKQEEEAHSEEIDKKLEELLG